MSDQGKQRWRELCERAVSERNPERLAKIIAEANKLIEEKRAGLRGNSSEPPKP